MPARVNVCEPVIPCLRACVSALLYWFACVKALAEVSHLKALPFQVSHTCMPACLSRCLAECRSQVQMVFTKLNGMSQCAGR